MVICWYQILTHSDQVFTAMLSARDAGFDFFQWYSFMTRTPLHVFYTYQLSTSLVEFCTIRPSVFWPQSTFVVIIFGSLRCLIANCYNHCYNRIVISVFLQLFSMLFFKLAFYWFDCDFILPRVGNYPVPTTITNLRNISCLMAQRV